MIYSGITVASRTPGLFGQISRAVALVVAFSAVRRVPDAGATKPIPAMGGSTAASDHGFPDLESV